jgi:two-component system, cell cycle sensor histidine kinase and response regulator CckA
MLWVVALAFLGVFLTRTWAQNASPVPSSDKRVLRVGLEPNTEPFSFVAANGKPAGFVVDLMDAIARDRDFQVEYVVQPWTDILTGVRAGHIHIIANIVHLPERAALFDFTIPHASLPGAVFVHESAEELQTIDDLRTRRLAVAEESVGHFYARRHGFEQNLVLVNSLQDSLLRLDRGKVDAVFAAKPIAEKVVSDLGLKSVVASKLALPGLSYELHMAVGKGQTELLYQLNLGIHHVHRSGIYESLYEKWLGEYGDAWLSWPAVRQVLLPALLALAVLLTILLYQRKLVRRLRVQADALRHSEERLMLALEGSQEAFWDWDVVANRVVRSARWSEILGYRMDEIASHADALNAWLHPEDVETVQSFKRQLLQGQGRAEYRVRAKDGGWRWVFDRGAVVARDTNGKPLRVTGMAKDITARKQTEAALLRSQKLLEQTQAIAQIGGWEYDLRSGAMYWTEQSYRIHEVDAQQVELSLERAIQFFTPPAQFSLRQSIEKTIRDGTPFDLELELVTGKGRLTWVRVAGRADYDGPKVVRIYGSYQDIALEKQGAEERQKLQLKMLEAQKLESLGVLAGGIAHDFNNLLTVIMGNTSLAREAPEAVRDALDQIEVASQRAADLCRQMLAYAGKSRFNIEHIDLNDVVSDTVQLLKLSISKSATLDFVFCPKPLPIDADASQIRQVVMNLVINASEALGGGNGTIRVSTTQLTATRQILREARLGQDLPPGEYVAFEIEDNGCGMSAETLARIFDPFFTTKFTGRGLGLAAVVGVVRAHRGALFVKSSLGRGTSFRILLPRSTAAQPVASAKKKAAGERLKPEGTILIVDDEPHVRRVASSILERQGYSVAVAADGYEALALGLAHGGKFSAVLLDLTMPGLDGPSTLKELRAMNPTLPVLIMSGFSEEEARKRLPSDPLITFLPKPFTADDLVRSLSGLRAQASLSS